MNNPKEHNNKKIESVDTGDENGVIHPVNRRQLPSSAKGSIKSINAGSEVIIYFQDLVFNDNIRLDLMEDVSGDIYSLLFIINPVTVPIRFKQSAQHQQQIVSQKGFLFGGRTRPDILLKKGERLQLVHLCFPLHALPADTRESFQIKIDFSVAGYMPLLISPKSYQQVIILFNEIFSNSALIQQKILCFQILEEMCSVFALTTNQKNRISFTHQEIMKAEELIIKTLEGKMPSIATIAQEVNLSESTLKRNFRIVFGKSLLEYYLDKKMELAKTLLSQHQLNVSEVSSRLGYENSSHFTSLFKKHTGLLPGKLKKSQGYFTDSKSRNQ